MSFADLKRFIISLEFQEPRCWQQLHSDGNAHQKPEEYRVWIFLGPLNS